MIGIDEEREAKRQKAMTDELICPITHEIPYDPVMAEDGQVYERSAIEEHFDTYSDQSLVRSRFTNESMGTRLITSTKTEALIVTLLENDLIIGELNEAWKKKDEAKKIVESSPLSAEKGDRPPLYEWTTRFSRGRPDLLGLVYEGPWRWVSSRNRIG